MALVTTYIGADLTALKQRVNVTNSDHDAWLEQVAETAAQLVDKGTRGYIPGCEAFSASASLVRYFDDYGDNIVLIDDAVTVTAVSRGGTALTSDQWKEWPYQNNRGNGPITKLFLRGDGIVPLAGLVGGSWYGTPISGVGVGQIAVTGTWGYCTAGNRPAIVKEATLLQAESMYEFSQLGQKEQSQALFNPWKMVAPRVDMLLMALKKE